MKFKPHLQFQVSFPKVLRLDLEVKSQAGGLQPVQVFVLLQRLQGGGRRWLPVDVPGQSGGRS